ncbi:MAG: histidine kinase [Actinomycetota bacterium]|nr:histidine kinase [Actinomycetota bacterium]
MTARLPGTWPLALAVAGCWGAVWLLTQVAVDPPLGVGGTVGAGLCLSLVAILGFPTALRGPRRADRPTRIARGNGRRDDEAIAVIGRPLNYLRAGLTADTAERTVTLLAPLFGGDVTVAVADPDTVLASVGDEAAALGSWLDGSASIAPRGAVRSALRVRGDVVGGLAVHRRGDPVDRRQVDSVARLLSLQLEIAELDRRAQLAADARLDALRAQINPHFLFNTLNTIASKSRTDPEEARQLLVRLADFFRYAIRGQGQFAEFNQEYFFVRTYLALEQARFGDRLRVQYDIDPQVLAVQVPALIIQPLVENAVKHGLSASQNGGTVGLRARVHPMSRTAWIEVRDDGVGMDPPRLARVLAADRHEDSRGGGVGLANIHERLDALFGERYEMNVRSKPGRGTTVALKVPLP